MVPCRCYEVIQLEGIQNHATLEVLRVQHQESDILVVFVLLAQYGRNRLIDHTPIIRKRHLQWSCRQDILRNTAFRDRVIEQRIQIIEVDDGELRFFVGELHIQLLPGNREDVDIIIVLLEQERTSDEAMLRRHLVQQHLRFLEPFVQQALVQGVVNDHESSTYNIHYINS